MNKRIFKDEDLECFFDTENPFEMAKQIEGEVYRDYANRKTKKFKLGSSSYFIKYHGPVGWKEILKNLIQFKTPVIGAEREWQALVKLQSLKIGCPEPVALMVKGWNPSNQESFLITKDLEETISLEDFFIDNHHKQLSAEGRRALLSSVAKICRTIHLNGLNHRDLYLCHFHIKNKTSSADQELSLIDLHRGQIRKKTPLRWMIKDIGGLLHSILPFGISETDCYRFLMVYFDCSLENLFKEKKRFIKKSRSRAFSMFMKPLLKEISISSKKQLDPDSLYSKKTGKDYRWIGKKNLLNKELLDALKDLDGTMQTGEIVKKERGHFIVSLNLGGKDFFIKKYQVKSILHFFRKIFSNSRAYTSWIAIHWLRSVNIRTVEPVIVYEQFNMLSVTHSYLITERIEGEILSEAIKKDKKDLVIASRIQSLFKKLRWIDFNHGDAKTSNFFFNQNNLIVFDLDASKKQLTSKMTRLKINKDIKRILRSTKSNESIYSLLSKRLDSK